MCVFNSRFLIQIDANIPETSQNEMLILPRNTVDKLRHIISGLNEQTSAGISKTGKKQDLIDRVRQVCNMWKTYGNADKWRKAKVILAQVRQNGS
jgi:E3 SUMO-protein ligase PIAS1